MSALPRITYSSRTARHVRKLPMIGIGGRLAAPPLPHHRAYGSVPRRFESLADTSRTRTGGRDLKYALESPNERALLRASRQGLFHCRLDADAFGPSRDLPDSPL